MAGDDDTRFHFDFGGITLELSGKRPFVEQMYRRVMEDVETVRRRVREDKAAGGKVAPAQARRPSVWVHRCSDMMRKIYMVSHDDVVASSLDEICDMGAVKNVYIAKNVFQKFFPDLEDGQTLWAEFTSVGREKIAEATKPMREVPDLPEFKLRRERAAESAKESKSKVTAKIKERLKSKRRFKSDDQSKP